MTLSLSSTWQWAEATKVRSYCVLFSSNPLNSVLNWASEMTQCVKAFALKLEFNCLGSRWWEERTDSYKLSSDLHTNIGACPSTLLLR